MVSQGLLYRGKKCSECDHTLPNSAILNTCVDHLNSALIKVKTCEVEFVYICPDNPEDNRRWIGGLMRKHKFTPQTNFHSHNSISSHRIPKKIRVDITSAVMSNPALKTTELACGQGLGYCSVTADLSAAHKGRFVNKY